MWRITFFCLLAIGRAYRQQTKNVVRHIMLKKLLGKSNMHNIYAYYFFQVGSFCNILWRITFFCLLVIGTCLSPANKKKEYVETATWKSNMYKICTYYFFQVAASTYSFFVFAGDRQAPITSKQRKIIRQKMLEKLLGKIICTKIVHITFSK